MHRFFYPDAMKAHSTVSLGADTSKHIWQVLRMEEGDVLQLTDGAGTVATGIIQFAERHKVNVKITNATFEPRNGGKLHLCIAFTRNNSRNEWLLEKATELGVASIIPVSSDRFHKAHIRVDRWEKILQSAILQSQQAYLPVLSPMMPVKDALAAIAGIAQKYIAHCIEDQPRTSFATLLNVAADAAVFIGPEGDFTPDEVNLCMAAGCTPVSLGRQRLRTETAAITVAAHFNLVS
jgi:16S rRNA (uracil1498-N3)-methyltransferase